MRVLCLNYEYPPVGGGGGRVAERLNTELVRRGHSVRVVTAGLKHLPREEVRTGVEILRPPSFRKREDTCTVPEMALYLATGLWPAIAEVRRWRPDVIHAHFAVPTGAVALLVHLATGVPYVITAHLGDVPGGVPEQTAGLFRWVGPLTRPIWGHAAATTAVSGFVAGLAREAYGVSPTVIYNGIDLPPPVARTPSHPRRILMVGRLSVQKNPLLAIRALAAARGGDCVLEIIGDGPLRAAAESEARALGLVGRVQFRGWMEGSAVAEAMARSDVLLLTSKQEGLPMVAVEALSQGLAIVGSDIPGLHDVVEDGVNGFLCAQEPGAFASALGRLSSDDALLSRFSVAARERAERFALSGTVDAYERILAKASRAYAG